MLSADRVVFLLDVDNTLLDNDRFGADLGAELERRFGTRQRERYWSIYAKLRDDRSYADYLGALQLFRSGLEDDPALLQMSAFLLDYPFASRLYPRALEAIAHLRTLGLVAILSDGDIVFQPRKIERSGIAAAVDGNVLVDVHKERALPAMRNRFPASHYVIVDDKPNLLAAMKRAMGATLTTVFVRQGHYAADSAGRPIDPAPDLAIDRIGDLLDLGLATFIEAPRERTAPKSQERA